MSRETINVVQQIKDEAVPGTAVAATRRFAGLSFDIGDTLETKQFRRMGAKFNTTNVQHKEWAAGSFSGPLSYSEIVYPLAGLFPHTITGPGAQGEYVWDFLPNPNGNDAVKTFTLEVGDDEAGERFKNLIIQSLEIPLSEDDAQMTGNCFSHASEDFALTAVGLVELAERPVSLREIDVFMDDTFAGIGTTKITDALEARLGIGEKFQPKWVLNTSHSSFKESKEVIPPITLSLTSEHNAQWRAFKTALKANPYKFFRVRANGPIIGGAIRYQLQMDFCGKVMTKTPQNDLAGLYAYQFDFAAMLEGTMSRGLKIQVTNLLATL